MKFTTNAAIFAAVASLAAATPLEKRIDVSITFHGEGDESYSMGFPDDHTQVKITNPMVVHRITSPGGGFCSLSGAKGESVVVYSTKEVELKEPQAMVSGNCGHI